jgi:hypothetical protein
MQKLEFLNVFINTYIWWFYMCGSFELKTVGRTKVSCTQEDRHRERINRVRENFRKNLKVEEGSLYIHRLFSLLKDPSKSDDQKVAATYEISNEYSKLSETAANSDNPVSRMAAFKKLTELLTVDGDNVTYHSPTGRNTILNKLFVGNWEVDYSLISLTIMNELQSISCSKYPDVRMAAIEILTKIEPKKYPSGELLTVIYDTFENALEAFDRISKSDEDSMFRIALDSKHADLRSKALENINDSNLLVELAIRSKDKDIFLASFERLDKNDSEVMLKVVKSESGNYAVFHESDEHFNMRLEAIEALRDENKLIQICQKYNLPKELKIRAMDKLKENKAALERVSNDHQVPFELREMAKKFLTKLNSERI